MDATPSSLPRTRRGGWITFPFITGAVAGLSLASTGIMENLIVYLIKEFNIKSITAAQISNVVNGCTSLFPILAAIIADSYLGSFTVASISACISFLGTILLTLTATLNSLRPPPCNTVGSKLMCKSPSQLQYAILYVGLTLTAIGFGGTRFTMATFGANQFEKQEEQSIFFNCFFFTLNAGSMISLTAIFYIEGEVSWALGFGICSAANLVAVAILLLGCWFYRPEDKPQGSPFVDVARVFVATIRKCKSQLSSSSSRFYGTGGDGNGTLSVMDASPGKRLRFFNRAALITEGDIQPDGSLVTNPWRLCTVQQVEDFKTLIEILPVWSTAIYLGTSIAIQTSLTILQALTMDRNIGSHDFKIPAGSMPVVSLLSTSTFLTLLDKVIFPTWQKLIGRSPTLLQQIGVGHVLNILGMAVSALVEAKRLKIVHSQQHNMSALWLCPQLIVVGIGVAFHFPGQVAFYYQQFPDSLKSTSIAMISLIIAIGNYLSTAMINLVERITGWLPDDINHGRLDNMYWILVVLGLINFAYYLLCSNLYKYQRG